MNERTILRMTRNVFVFIGMCFCFSCAPNPETNEVVQEPSIVGGGLQNFAVLNGDTIYQGAWDTGLKSIKINGNTVVYDCSHLFHGYYWRWCGDSLFELDTNVVLNEVNKKINFADSSFWCLSAFSLTTVRTDSSFSLNSRFKKGDTVFYQKSFWRDRYYWLIE